MSSEQSQNQIEDSIEEGLVREIAICGKPSLQIVEQDAPVFRDPCEHASTNTEPLQQTYVTHEQFDHMQSQLLAEIHDLRRELAERPTPIIPSSQDPGISQQLITTLTSQVQFLQNTVSTIMSSQSQQTQLYNNIFEKLNKQTHQQPMQLREQQQAPKPPIAAVPPPPIAAVPASHEAREKHTSTQPPPPINKPNPKDSAVIDILCKTTQL